MAPQNPRRLDALRELPSLEITDDVARLWRALVRQAALPSTAAIDALHVAVAAVHRMDYLLAWNCAHIANAMMRAKIEAVCRVAGFEPPVICTPLELMQEE